MENENVTIKNPLDEIGYKAKMLDSQMTITQRMKIKKQSIKKIIGALGFYLAMMLIFSAVI